MAAGSRRKNPARTPPAVLPARAASTIRFADDEGLAIMIAISRHGGRDRRAGCVVARGRPVPENRTSPLRLIGLGAVLIADDQVSLKRVGDRILLAPAWQYSRFDRAARGSAFVVCLTAPIFRWRLSSI